MNKSLRVLHVEDSERDAALITRHLARAGYAPVLERVDTSAAMISALETKEWDVILCDYSMPNFNALQALELLQKMGLDIPFIIISGVVGETAAVEAMRAGAHDYLMKDNLARLVPTIERELHEVENHRARRQAEEALKASEGELRTLFEAMTDVIIVVDSEGRYLKVAPTKSANSYVRADDRIGKTVHEVFPRATADLFVEALHEALAEGQVKKLEYRLPIEGNDIWFEASISPMSRDTILVIARDITERKHAEEEFRQSQTQLAEAQQLAHVGSWSWDLQNDTLIWSDQHYQILGFAPGEIDPAFESLVAKYIHPEDRDLVRGIVENSLRTLEPFSFQYRIVRPDGLVRVIDSRGSVVADEQGIPARMFGTTQDVTELKQSEEELKQLNSKLESKRLRLNNIIASVPGLVWEAWGQPDAATQRIDFVSDYVETLLGYTVEQWLSTPNFWLSIVHLDDKERVAKQAAASFATLSNCTMEFRWIARDGRVVWVESTFVVVADDEGRPAGLRGVNVDITERKKLEEQLRQAQKMEAIGTLAGGIAHDFNNILGVIIGYSELAQMDVTAGSRAQDHLGQVLKAGARARDLVRQILTFSRRAEPELEVIQLQAIIGETLKLLRASLPSTIEIRQNIDSSAPSVLGDATQIQQVIMNLCVNSGQAMKERGGVLEIGLNSLYIDPRFASAHPDLKEGPHLCLKISDTGCGMNRTTQARIFDPFFTTKAPGEGTGLGLAVVHGLIKSHAGAIAVDSQLGVGTNIDIYLPVGEDQAGAVVPKSVSVPRGNGQHILFVDDEEALVSLGKSMLEHLGYRVTTRTDSVEALATFRSQPRDFDLVITDQTMPDLNGADLATALLQIQPAVPVILTTGYSAVMSREQASVIGIREVLLKPNTMQALAEAIGRTLGPTRKE